MAERTVTVRLRALVDDYKRAMADAGKATADVANQGEKWQKLGQSAAALGDSLTTRVTLPIVAVGAAAFKLSSDFDNAFTRMQSLAGVSAREVDGLKESVLGLAGETGRAPQELAEALYFLRSSGLDGAQAMEALEVSAKASAAGLGNTATIADAVSSAMNAYAREGLKAAEATDILVATARAGKAEPEQLAASLGQVLPVASELGVTFEDVGGAVAALSLSGNDAARSSTLLTNVLSKLLKPSEQGAELLEQVGLSADGIRRMIAERGLLGTLEELKARLGDAGFVKFLEDTQAIQGALALTGQNADKVRDVFDQVADSAGATQSAFETWADSMGANNARAWAELQTALIRLGDTIAPIAADVANAIGSVSEAFGDLPEGAQQAILYAGLFVAALGPILSVGGRVVSAIGSLSTAAAKAGTSLGGLATGLGIGGAIYIGLTAIDQVIGSVVDSTGESATNIDKLTNSMLKFAETGRLTGELADLAGDGFEKLKDAVNDLDLSGADKARESVDSFVSSIPVAGRALGTDFAEGLDKARERLNDFDQALVQLNTTDPAAAAQLYRAAVDELGLSASQADELFDGYTGALASADTAQRTNTDSVNGQADALNGAAAALMSYSDALRAQFDPLFAVTSANAALAEANAAVNDAVAEFGAQSPQAVAAHLAASEAAVRQQGALGELATAVRNGTVDVDAAVAKLNDWVAQGLITQASADATAAEFYGVRDAANSVPGSVSSDITTNAYSVRLSIEGVGQALNDVDGRNVTVHINYAYRAYGDVPGAAEALRGIPRQHGGPVSADRLYEVNEGGIAEYFQAGGRTYLLPGMTGHVTPASQYAGATAAAPGAGGGPTVINELHLQTPDSPRQWLDEIPWRLAS